MSDERAGRGPLPEAEETVHALRSGRAVMELSLDAIFETLANRRRRFLLRVLQSRETAHVDDLAARVQEREWSADRSAPALATIRRSVEQVHLPLLVEHGLADYDERSGDVRFYGHPVVEEYLEHTAALEEFSE